VSVRKLAWDFLLIEVISDQVVNLFDKERSIKWEIALLGLVVTLLAKIYM